MQATIESMYHDGTGALDIVVCLPDGPVTLHYTGADRSPLALLAWVDAQVAALTAVEVEVLDGA